MKPQLKNTLRVVPKEESHNTQYREVKPHKELRPPHFPDETNREVSHGTLSGWLDRLRKK